MQSDGKIIAGGSDDAFPGGSRDAGDFALARYNADGSLDTTFSMDGKQTTDLGAISGLALQSDGKIVAGGSDDAGDFALARYNADGSLDAGFSGDGRQTTDLGGSDSANGVALQSDGKIVAVGDSIGVDDFALARYNLDGTLDTSFSGDGKQTTDLGGSDSANGVALQSDGKVVAVGDGRGSESADFAVARYDGAGAPPDVTPPETSITSGPVNGSTTADSTPTFLFTSSEPGSTFSCRVDGGGAAACSSPRTTAALSDGAHSFSVAATDAAGNTDATPASRSFTVRVPAPPPQPPPQPLQPPGPQPPALQLPAPQPLDPQPPAQEPGDEDTTPPRASLGGSRAFKLGRSLRVRVRCSSERCTAKVNATVRVPRRGRAKAKTYRVKRVTKRISRGASALVTVKLSKTSTAAIRRSLRQRNRKSTTLKLRVVVTDTAGNARTLRRDIKVTR